MDTIEDLNQYLKSLPLQEKEEELERFKEQCICPICPSYNDCAKKKGELLYCVTGESENCITVKKDCLCPPCPFARRLSFGARYNTYCIRGSEMEQRE